MSGVVACLMVGQPGSHPLNILQDYLTDHFLYHGTPQLLFDYIMDGVVACLIIGQPGSHPLHIYWLLTDKIVSVFLSVCTQFNVLPLDLPTRSIIKFSSFLLTKVCLIHVMKSSYLPVFSTKVRILWILSFWNCLTVRSTKPNIWCLTFAHMGHFPIKWYTVSSSPSSQWHKGESNFLMLAMW